MSKDKHLSKRNYKIRGAVTKRKLRQAHAGGGKKAKPGNSWVTFCPTCPMPKAIAISPECKEISCDQGHAFKVI